MSHDQKVLDGNAIVYCRGAFNTPNGKTAHGLVRFTNRYKVLAVIDDTYAGEDSGQVLDGSPNGIPLVENLEVALQKAAKLGETPQYFVIGLAPDGGKLPQSARESVIKALVKKLHVDSGLHDFISDDLEVARIALENDRQIRDVRKTPPRRNLHFFSGEIEKVKCLKIAVLGTDSAIGKRTTAWIIVNGFRRMGKKAEMIGTGQTGWMQGAKYSIILDSLINDFVSGEIEHAVVEAYRKEDPDIIVIEGQGSLMNPAYPGGFEILAAGRPDYIVMQHAPRRSEYDGFPGYKLHPLAEQIKAVEMISGKKVIAVTVNHENMTPEEVHEECSRITSETGLPAMDVLLHGPDTLLEVLKPLIR